MRFNKAWCLFEQSGAFKNQFIARGIEAVDFDISNDYGETDRQIDLFRAIDDAWEGRPSIFDAINPETDIVMAFYPCIYFSTMSQVNMKWAAKTYRKLPVRRHYEVIRARVASREESLMRLIRLCCIAIERGIKMIIENPATTPNYLTDNFPWPPSIIDKNRRERGDYYIKPTAYWFFNLIPGGGKRK